MSDLDFREMTKEQKLEIYNKEGFEELLLSELPFLNSWIKKHYKLKVSDQEDLMSISVEKMLQFGYMFELGTFFRGWSTTVIRNVFNSEYRRRKKYNEVVVPLPRARCGKTIPIRVDPERELCGFSPNSPDHQVHVNFTLTRIFEVMNEGTNPLYVEVMRMAELDDMSYKEISEELGIKMGTVMSRLYRARLAAKKLLILDPEIGPILEEYFGEDYDFT